MKVEFYFLCCVVLKIANNDKDFTLLFYNFSLPQEDSDYEREHTPPTPPPRKLSRKGASLRLRCLGKQESDENPLMKKVAEPLKLTQTQVVQRKSGNGRCWFQLSFIFSQCF